MKITLFTLVASMAALAVARSLPAPAADFAVANEEERRTLQEDIAANIPRAAHVVELDTRQTGMGL